METEFECVIVGGGAAGLSAALVLGRARRKTLLIDAGGQSNLPAHGIGGLLGHDEKPPARLYAEGGAEIDRHPSVTRLEGRVVRASREDGRFAVECEDGSRHRARRVLLATGMDYELPDLAGIHELWGDSVFHCPFCHGWEVRDGRLAMLGADSMSALRALMLSYWSDDVTLLTNGPDQLTGEDRGRLAAAGVAVETRPISGLAAAEGKLRAIEFAEGDPRPMDGLMVPAKLVQRNDLAAQLGLETEAESPVMVDPVTVTPHGETSVKGVFAAGDLSPTMPSIAASIAEGSLAAAGIVHSLMAEDFPVPAVAA